MRQLAKAQFAILGTAITALTLTVAACGGGGTSSGGAGAGGSAVASVSGTVNGGSASALKMHPGVGPAYLIAAFGELVIPMAYAAGRPGVLVEVNCGTDAMFTGTTDINGKFKVLVPNVGSGNCTTTFDGARGPDVSLSPGMETAIEVILASDNTVNLVGIEQRANNQTELEIEVDDGTDNLAGRSDDASSDGPSNDAVSNDAVSDDDNRSIDQASDDGQSSGGTGTS